MIASSPGSPEIQESSGYSKRVQWIKAYSFVAVKGEFFDPAGRLLKTITASDIRRVDSEKDRWQAMRLEAVNKQTGHSTIIQMENFRANQGLLAQAFAAGELDREQ